MFAHSNDPCVEVVLELNQRLMGLLEVPDRGSRHPEDLRTQRNGTACIMFAHDAIVGMILLCVMTFVEDYEGHLDRVGHSAGDETR